MGNEGIQSNKPSLMSELGTSVAFSAGITGIGGVNSVIRNRGIGKTLKSLPYQEFKQLDATLKTTTGDVFSKSIRHAQNYDIYKDAAKKAQKFKNMRNAAGTDLSLWQKFKNIFRKNKLTVADAEKMYNEANGVVNRAKGILMNGGDLVDDAAVMARKTAAEAVGKATAATGQEAAALAKEAKSAIKAADAAETAAKMASGSGLNTAKNLFKSELKNKFVLGITVLGAIPRIKDEVIPAFKEKGFIEGIKTTAKVVARTGADFISNAGFSAVGRAIGSTIGGLICPVVGAGIGGTFGDVIGSFFSMKLVSKIFDKGENKEQAANGETIAQNDNAQSQINEAELSQLRAQRRQELTQGNAYKEKIYEQSTRPRTQSSYVRPRNGVYKTGWVNELHKQRASQAQNQNTNYYA